MDRTTFLPMDDKHLGQFGENTARAFRPEGWMGGRPVWRLTLECLQRVTAVRDRVWRAEKSGAAEWLLDNWYLAQREGRDGAAAFRKARRLRYIVRDRVRRPLVLELARAFVWGAGADAGPQRLELFLERAQGAQPLTERELSLFVPALKCALVERLDLLCRELNREDGEEERLSAGMGSVFTALRTLSTADLSGLLERASRVEAILQSDPAGVYSLMDDETRGRYRHQVCRLARQKGLSEIDTAERAIQSAAQAQGEERHVGFQLFEPQTHLTAGVLYVGAVVVTTLFLSLLLGFRLDCLWAPMLLLLPVSDIVKNGADFLVVRLVHPRPVHRLALKEGVPEEGRTLCVIASLLTDGHSGDKLAALLERYRLANRDAGAELRFGLLADLPDRDSPMGEAERRWTESARNAVEGLNAKYGGGFYLFFRRPAFHAVDERYMGWERKRGALVELVRLLKGRRSGLEVLAGDRTALKGTRYVITLDSDTCLSVGTARELVGAMLHPMNRPRVDPRRRVVVSGYGLLQPRVGVELEAANHSQFSRIFAGQGGVDPYGSAASDVYHDLFDEGTYTGKGIFDVDVFFTCLDRRFPENTILSHDLLEGAYLRAGLIGDVELTDGYPYKVTSYFSRLHRWVRGDWQLLPWLGRTVRDENGRREANPVGPIAKWKLFDNLRRSLVPVSTLLALVLGMCLSGPVFAAAAGVAVLAAASHLLLSGADLAFRRGRGLTERYHSTIITGFGGVLLQTLVQLLFLPYQAWICASAALTALWRMGVSHKKLLAWTTAAEAERRAGDGLWANYQKMWPSVAAGLLCVVCSRFPAGAAVGLVWMASPVFSWAMSRPVARARRLEKEDRPFLLHQAALIWQYFAEFLRPQDHWLPPDNWQEQPAVGLARRTSPTNIGMALLCCLAAADLELTPRNRALSLIGHILDTVEKLPKWHGHLYNWYDTAAAVPLEPRYVSTVDSGNLCGCLIALEAGLREWGADGEADRAAALGAAMEFAPLYDATRRLFYIGYDCTKGEYTQGWYDLMASEARQTSYIAVARGEVEPRHWRRLSRALVSWDHYCGMASWTGTMFEYFMPHLLLPAEPNSLLYESLTFCAYAQRKRVAGTGAPWGISESAFYSFDAGLNYQYKAHGVQRLGLKRGLDRELVISPYSTFLTLPLAPGRAVRNLRRLRDMGLEGPYGLYEAADFTPDRRTGGKTFEPVRSYMAHHLGMSLVAIDNTLNGPIMQRRFMGDAAMASYRELLQEKVPVGAQVLRAPRREVPEKPRRGEPGGFQRMGEGCDRSLPECHLLSGGAWRVLCTDAGASRSVMGGTDLTRCSLARPWQGPGVALFLSGPEGLMPLTPAPFYREAPAYGWRFDGNGAAWTMEWNLYASILTLQVSEEENGELREVTLRWNGAGERTVELVCYLEPVLARREDYEAHPAFSKLSLESRDLGDGVLFTRRPRRSGENRPAMAVLWEGAEARLDTSRETALGRGGLLALESALTRPPQGTEGAVLDPCLLARFPLTLSGGTETHFRMALSAADDGDHAVESAARLLRRPEESRGGRMDWLIRQLNLTSEITLHAFELLRRLQFPDRSPVRPGSEEQRALWPFGISGDLPIAVLPVEAQEQLEDALRLTLEHQFLDRSGFRFDLVFLLSEGGDYRQPIREELLEGLRDQDWSHRIGVKGGVYLLDAAQAAGPLQSVGLLLGTGGSFPERKSAPEDTVKEINLSNVAEMPAISWARSGAFSFQTGETLPPVGWSMMLCNGSFGWMTDETGGGHLWHGNAREQPLTRWQNDPLAIGGPEELLYQSGEEVCSFFAHADGMPCQVTYFPGNAKWEKTWRGRTIRCTAFVPPDLDARILLLEAGGEGRVLYRREGEAERSWSIRDRLCLRTGPEGTEPIDFTLADRLFRETEDYWREKTGALWFDTPDQALDRYLNGWAPYQIIACRLFGRTSLYQNGGAFGFRDQLQDVCAVLPIVPELARAQILRACAHQYREGDVMHWWHPGQNGAPDKGVRTRISDDLLWLPYALCEYLDQTGDRSLLNEQVEFLVSNVLAEGERERYEEPARSEERAAVLEHALRAADRVLDRGFGVHGLALMGTGDWNDGMDLVGAGGSGESVWLTWFLGLVLRRLLPLCGEARSERYQAALAACARAANAAWDGEWFLRGYYDDGATLGSHADQACQIDSLPQSFAVISGMGEPERTARGLRAALDRLFDREHAVVRLFTPPFDEGERDPGYIRGYLPGVRENGGQYTHAAVWLALACLRMDWRQEGWEVLRALLPSAHDPAGYRAEPYVLAADVYSNPLHQGRGGWSWYTGAAGWYYRTAVEELLGLKLRAGLLYLEPKLPEDWPGFSARWQSGKGLFHIQVRRGGTKEMTLDGRSHAGGIPIRDLTGEHTILFTF